AGGACPSWRRRGRGRRLRQREIRKADERGEKRDQCWKSSLHEKSAHATPDPWRRGILRLQGASMKRREFIVSSVAGSVGAGLAHNPLAASAIDGTQARPATGRRILIAGGNFN